MSKKEQIMSDKIIEFESPDYLVDWFDHQLEHIRENPERFKFPPEDFEKVFDWVLAVDYRQKKRAVL